MDEFDRKYDDAIEALANARAEIERLTLENGKIANTLGAENLMLRAALHRAAAAIRAMKPGP